MIGGRWNAAFAVVGTGWTPQRRNVVCGVVDVVMLLLLAELLVDAAASRRRRIRSSKCMIPSATTRSVAVRNARSKINSNCFDRLSSGLRYVCDWIVAVIQNRFVKCRGWDEDEVVVDAILANSTVPYAYETRPVRVRDASRTRCLLYTSPSPRDLSTSRMPSSA